MKWSILVFVSAFYLFLYQTNYGPFAKSDNTNQPTSTALTPPTTTDGGSMVDPWG